MFADPVSQLQLLSAALIFGLLTGIFYDFLRAFRSFFKSKAFAAFADIVFCFIYFICLFLLGYTAGKGIQRLYAPAFSALGAAIYFCSLSPVFLPVFTKILGFVLIPIKFLMKTLKKLWNLLKNFFYSAKICYTIKCSRKSAAADTHTTHPSVKGTADEAEKGRYYY